MPKSETVVHFQFFSIYSFSSVTVLCIKSIMLAFQIPTLSLQELNVIFKLLIFRDTLISYTINLDIAEFFRR